MKRFFILIIIFTMLYACKPGIPKNLIQPDKMKQVLTDIHIVDGYVSNIANPDSVKILASAYYKGVYNKFGIDSAVYNKSLNYYYEHPNLMKQMYDSITVTLDKMKSKIYVSSVDPYNSIYLKGIFAKGAIDSSLLDNNLNLKYNYRPLRKNTFSSFANSLPSSTPNLTPVNSLPPAQSNPEMLPGAVAEPAKEQQPIQHPKE